jgi:hypothetical protein
VRAFVAVRGIRADSASNPFSAKTQAAPHAKPNARGPGQ